MEAHVTDDQKLKDLVPVVSGYNSGHYYVGLFKASFTPSHSMTFSDLVEANFPGYSRVRLTGGVVAGTVDGTFHASATFDAVAFTQTGASPANDIYGYFVIDQADGLLAWVDPRSGGTHVAMDRVALVYTVTPVFTLTNDPAP